MHLLHFTEADYRPRPPSFPEDPPARRILIVMQDFASGGTERVAVRLANSWARAGREVRIFCGSEDGPTRRLVAPGVQVVPAAPRRSRSLWSRLMLGRALVDAAITGRPDVIFAPGNFHLIVLVIYHWLAGDGAVPTVCKLSNPLGAGLYRGLLRCLTSRITCFTAMSPVLRDEARRFLGRDDLEVAPDPIDLRPPMHRIRRPGAPIRLLSIGRLEPQKDLALAIRALAVLRRERDAELLILGEGRERRRLMKLARRLGVAGHVAMPGHCPSIDWALQRSDILLSTSRYEGYPAAQVEALASGLPVVSTRCSAALSELAAEGQAITLVERDPVAIASVLMARPAENRASAPLHARHGPDAIAGYLAVLDAVAAGVR